MEGAAMLRVSQSQLPPDSYSKVRCVIFSSMPSVAVQEIHGRKSLHRELADVDVAHSMIWAHRLNTDAKVLGAGSTPRTRDNSKCLGQCACRMLNNCRNAKAAQKAAHWKKAGATDAPPVHRVLAVLARQATPPHQLLTVLVCWQVKPMWPRRPEGGFAPPSGSRRQLPWPCGTASSKSRLKRACPGSSFQTYTTIK